MIPNGLSLDSKGINQMYFTIYSKANIFSYVYYTFVSILGVGRAFGQEISGKIEETGGAKSYFLREGPSLMLPPVPHIPYPARRLPMRSDLLKPVLAQAQRRRKGGLTIFLDIIPFAGHPPRHFRKCHNCHIIGTLEPRLRHVMHSFVTFCHISTPGRDGRTWGAETSFHTLRCCLFPSAILPPDHPGSSTIFSCTSYQKYIAVPCYSPSAHSEPAREPFSFLQPFLVGVVAEIA